ncbi:hypothetical protein AB0M28_02960 [Streptomyces sp. NPDC051940]|uniref:hypothetical protein n=1 Tax=Streptomyces sp. NPDC051940 TaxID=3155675 RepID=UPI0034269EE9
MLTESGSGPEQPSGPSHEGGRDDGRDGPRPGDGSGDAEQEYVPRRLPPGWKGRTIIALLIGVPLVYLCISFLQSRDAGRDKAEKANATNLTDGWPTKVQRRIYEVPMPEKAGTVRHYETNSWKSSTLWVEFNTSPMKLPIFLKDAGTSEADLKKGYVPITKAQADKVGWDLNDGRTWWGTRIDRPGSGPDVEIAVSYDRFNHPAVRVVSTIDF